MENPPVPEAVKRRIEELKAEVTHPWRHKKQTKPKGDGMRWHPNNEGVKRKIESGECTQHQLTKKN